jgi:hypothetical protein
MTSPTPNARTVVTDFQDGGTIAVPPNNAGNAVYASSAAPDIGQITIPAAANFDTGANAIVLPTVQWGMLVLCRNNQATDVLVKGSKVGDPGAIVPAGTQALLANDGTGAVTAFVPEGAAVPGPTFSSVLARGQVDANVPNLASFAVAGAGRDGITYVAGDTVVLNKQTTVAQNGPYIVGTVVAGNAPLTRPSWWPIGSTIPSSFEFKLGEDGTLYGGLTLYVTAGSGNIVDTDDPALFFREVGAVVQSGVGTTFVKGLSGFTFPAAGKTDIALTTPGVDFTNCSIQVTLRTLGVTAGVVEVGVATGTHIEVDQYAGGALTNLDYSITVRSYK